MVVLDFVGILEKRLKEREPLIQFVIGPRQAGKTTGVSQLLSKYKGPVHSVIAEESFSHSHLWLREQWQTAESQSRDSLLVVDEIQKIENWSETVKFLWDDSIKRKKPLKCLFLGSSSLQLSKGMSESLAGRFEVIRVHHWDFQQSVALKKMKFEKYLQIGGYPGSYRFIDDAERWRNYIKHSVVESVLTKDISLFSHLRKPALFRQAVELMFSYPAQVVSYTKLLGQLQERGNAETVKNYIHLMEAAFLIKPLEKFSSKKHLTKASSPKIVPLCPALITAFHENVEPGRLFEAYIGQLLVREGGDLFYWQAGDKEVDYVYRTSNRLFAIEVKSGRKRSRRGLDEFLKTFPKSRPLFIDQDNVQNLKQLLNEK